MLRPSGGDTMMCWQHRFSSFMGVGRRYFHTPRLSSSLSKGLMKRPGSNSRRGYRARHLPPRNTAPPSVCLCWTAKHKERRGIVEGRGRLRPVATARALLPGVENPSWP